MDLVERCEDENLKTITARPSGNEVVRFYSALEVVSKSIA